MSEELTLELVRAVKKWAEADARVLASWSGRIGAYAWNPEFGALERELGVREGSETARTLRALYVRYADEEFARARKAAA